MEKVRATVFHGIDDIRVEEVKRPHAGGSGFESRYQTMKMNKF